MSPTTHPLRPRRTAAVILVALSLAGISACSISVGGGSSDQETAAAAGQEESAPKQSAAASQATTATTDSQATTATTDSQAPRSETAAPSAQEQTSPTTVGSSAPAASAQPASGDRPGARATLTDSDWLSDLEFVDRTVSANPSMLLDKSNDDVRVEGDVDSLSVTASNTKVFVDYVGLLTVSGSNVTVYVKDVDRVVIKGSGAEVVWAGNTPKVEDFGTNTETRLQGSGD
ncbi:DUF3060 domain-containing protein [Actinomyces stomatis]|uniref:DUF3060 domain-containing protein n=1 Tax=Actinomyces stomatis TaxID=3050227 RepID=UPI0028525CC8|nr:DUF3060 domain-containing protein [Actinomyces sp. PK606]